MMLNRQQTSTRPSDSRLTLTRAQFNEIVRRMDVRSTFELERANFFTLAHNVVTLRVFFEQAAEVLGEVTTAELRRRAHTTAGGGVTSFLDVILVEEPAA